MSLNLHSDVQNIQLRQQLLEILDDTLGESRRIEPSTMFKMKVVGFFKKELASCIDTYNQLQSMSICCCH